jgi:hypothetical protein
VSFSFALNRNDILPGDWDLDRMPIQSVVKVKSVVEHFRDGVEWENTELFELYTDQLNEGISVRRGKSIDELKSAYVGTIDRLFYKIKNEGFLLPGDRERGEADLPCVHISRDGEILLGNNGSHRLGIALALNLERIPCVVHARHVLWQKKREDVFERLSKSEEPQPAIKFDDHPDLADLFATFNSRPN